MNFFEFNLMLETYGLGQLFFYHRLGKYEDPNKPDYSIKNFFSTPYEVHGGSMYGPGLYGTTELEEQFHPNMKNYGEYVVRFMVDIKNNPFLCNDPQITPLIFGRYIPLYQQMIRLNVPLEKIINQGKKEIAKGTSPSSIYGNAMHRKHTHQFALPGIDLKDIEYFEIDKLFEMIKPWKFGIKGCIYKGDRDGKSVVVYDPNIVKIMDYVYAPITKEKPPINSFSDLAKGRQNKDYDMDAYHATRKNWQKPDPEWLKQRQAGINANQTKKQQIVNARYQRKHNL